MSTFHERFVDAFTIEAKRREVAGEPRLTKTMVWKAAKASSGAFTHWFNGSNGMDLDTCFLVSTVLRVSPKWLFDGSGERSLSPSSDTQGASNAAQSEKNNNSEALRLGERQDAALLPPKDLQFITDVAADLQEREIPEAMKQTILMMLSTAPKKEQT